MYMTGEEVEAMVGSLLDGAVRASEAGQDYLAGVLHEAASAITDAWEFTCAEVIDGDG